MRAILFTSALGLFTALSACGDTTGEQVAFGAGAGAIGSALLGGHLLTGAAVGTAANLIYCKESPGGC